MRSQRVKRRARLARILWRRPYSFEEIRDLMCISDSVIYAMLAEIDGWEDKDGLWHLHKQNHVRPGVAGYTTTYQTLFYASTEAA